MSDSIQQFLGAATRKAVADITEAFLSIPEDKRDWKPGGNARSAVDILAECALNNGYTAALIETGQIPSGTQEQYSAERSELAKSGWDNLKALLDKNTEIVILSIENTPDARLSEQITLPWGKTALTETLTYPYWNMSYHLGQINAISLQLEKPK